MTKLSFLQRSADTSQLHVWFDTAKRQNYHWDAVGLNCIKLEALIIFGQIMFCFPCEEIAMQMQL